MNSSIPHELENFMEQVTAEMEAEYLRIRSRASEDPGTAGDQGEENWAELLREWLPPTYRVVTKGRILSPDGRASPQVDVLVLKDVYPEKLLNKKLYLSAGVAAAFECKTTLTANHIKQAAKTCVEIKSLCPDRTGTPYRETHSPIIYGLLSHSHSWKSPNSKPATNVEFTWVASDHAHSQHPKDSLDLICVSDLGMWCPAKFTFIATPNFDADPRLESVRDAFPDPLGTARIAYTGFIPDRDYPRLKYTPIGAFMVKVYNALAWEIPSLRGLAEYFTLSGIGGNGEGTFRHWQGKRILIESVLEVPVIPAFAGIQVAWLYVNCLEAICMDSRFRGNDGLSGHLKLECVCPAVTGRSASTVRNSKHPS